MIGIVAGNEISPSVEEVIDWLDFYGKKWERIIGSDYFDQKEPICINGFNSQNNFLNKYTSIWYRGFFRNRLLASQLLSDLDADNENVIEMYKILTSEINVMRKHLFTTLDKTKSVPDFKSIDKTKLEVLHIAHNFGLKTPDFLVTNSKKHLEDFYLKKKGKVITKPLHEVSFFLEKDIWYRYLTHKVEKVEKMPDLFFPSFFQEQIEKMYELRVFVLDKEIYPMVIFSQSDKLTEVDFRNYNDNKPNRTAPYKLPNEINKALIKIFSKLNLNTGSVDFIRSINGDYYFLEINPLGQFGMTSKPCNYHLEKKIAEFLI